MAASARHDFRLAISYESIESDGDLQTGGGPLRVQWSARWSGERLFAPATDIVVGLPNGDGGLHPLSAKAPSVEGRLRLRLGGGLWVGTFARRVSPPNDRVDPEAWFPSGGGFDLGLRRDLGRLGLVVDLRNPTAGLPRAAIGLARLSWLLSEGVTFEVGAAVALGPQDSRLIESGWQIGLRYSRERSTGAPPP